MTKARSPLYPRRLATAGLTILLSALLVAVPLVGQATETYAPALADWEAVLERFVDAEGRTDFVRLAGEPARLEAFVAYLASNGPETRPNEFATEDEQLAYYINAYNALAMHGVVERDIPDDFDSFFKRLGFFKLRGVSLDGDTTNLYDLENQVIRPFGDPRIHFALNCMVRDCPRLPRSPFRAAELDAQLEAASREFFADPKHLERDPQAGVVRVSAILDFYTKDFAESGRRADLVSYINRYAEPPIPADWTVEFMPYDWTVNQQP